MMQSQGMVHYMAYTVAMSFMADINCDFIHNSDR